MPRTKALSPFLLTASKDVMDREVASEEESEVASEEEGGESRRRRCEPTWFNEGPKVPFKGLKASTLLISKSSERIMAGVDFMHGNIGTICTVKSAERF